MKNTTFGRMVAACVLAFVVPANAADLRQWKGAAPTASVEDAEAGFSRLVTTDGCYQPSLDAVGRPALPGRTVLFAVPDRMEPSDLTVDVEWEPLGDGVRMIPVSEPVRVGDEPSAPRPDPLVYGGTDAYPVEPAVRGAIGTMSGVRVLPVTVTPFRWHPVSGLLERATRIVVSVGFDAGTERSYLLSSGLSESIRAAVVNPADVSEGKASPPVRTTTLMRMSSVPKLATADASSERTDPVDYLLVSPPEFAEDWAWYVRERKKTHANLVFRVVNTADIYRDYPFAPSNDCRNAAESIHAYLRAHWKQMGFTYVVLGGAWLDAQNLNGTTTYFASGETMSLSNCVPGIYGFPRENWRQIPSDLFYGCLDIAAGQKYPWDRNGDGKYIDQNDCANNNTYPDVIVSRITLNPFTGIAGKVYNQHTLITNYVAKLARGEAKDFPGHYCYGMSAASTGSSKQRKTGDRMYYRELEFYDGMLNMFDPRHHDTLEDDEYSTRVRYYDQYSNWRPLRQVKGMMSYTWTGGLPTLAAAMDDYYASDRDFGFVQAHGWAQGAAQFSAGRFATAKGLTLFNGGSGPCETGYPDYYVTSGGKAVLQYNVGDAAVTNPDGGALASVNNSRWSWAGGGGGFAAMSYYMLNEMLIGFNQERLDVGHAWIKGVRNYWPAGRWGNTAGWVLSEQFLYGDPLVRLPKVPNVWWMGGETGVWDNVTANWTNDVDSATAFDAAYNVYFNVQTNLDLDVAGEIAAMRLSIPVWEEDAVLTLAGTGTLRVMQCVDIAGTNTTLRFDVEGGVGHDGIRFLTGPGEIVFGGTNKFYVGGVRNTRRVKLLGGGVTLDVDEFPAGNFPLLIDGPGADALPLPNVLRSKNVGGLTRFGSLAITNSYVKLSTVDAFGNGAPMTHALVDSELEIAANVYYQRSGFPEGLNATFLVDGDSSVTSSLGGLWTVKHTTTFALGAARPESAPYRGTHLTLSAETVNAGGRIVITNVPPTTNYQLPTTNSVEVLHASALAGDVTIGAGIRLVLHELPLSSVTSLTVEEGATVVLPDEASGYWQIVPVSSKFVCGSGVTFATASNPSVRLDGSPSPTGSFFKEGALYRWTGEEGDWTRAFAYSHPKILFGDQAANVVTVRVAGAVSPEFVFFSNLDTKYAFEPVADGASVFFSSVFLYGPTVFCVPVAATEYVTVSTETSSFINVAAPYVHVASGAGLALAGAHWTDFRLDAGAVLVAVPGQALDWNAQTTFTFPDDGKVLVDVGGLVLSEEPTLLVTGFGHEWTLSDLTHFRLVQPDAEFRIIDGALCVVKGDGLKGPYELTFEGATNWNNSAWTAASNAFPKVWGDCALDWSAEVVVSVATNPMLPSANYQLPATNYQLTVDCDVRAETLTIHAGTNDFALACGHAGRVTLPVLEVGTLDLTDCHGLTDIGVDTGAATIRTASSTNGTDVIHLRGTGSGVIELSGSTLVMDRPGDFTLTAGAQGILRVAAPQAYERFRIAKVPSDFKNSGLTVVVTDADGDAIGGFQTSVSDGALWCVPPVLQAEVPPGTNDITRLVWRDVLGNVVSNVDWTSSAGFRLIGTETSGVVIAKSGFASVWNRLSVTNAVTLYGNETLTVSSLPGPGVMSLAGAFTVKANVRAYPTLLTGSRLELLGESTLEISHGGANFDATAQNWSGITGTGRIRFTDGSGTYFAVPSSLFADTLRVETASDIVLTGYVTDANPFGVRNLSGDGTFRTDWHEIFNVRPIRTVQTGVSAYSGCLKAINRNRDSKLVVASDAPAATMDKALILNGTKTFVHTLDIEPTGCVILTGSWQGPINVSGLLVITNACATNGLQVTVRSGGEVRTVAPDVVPAVTAAPDYVAPAYPDDPVVPDVPVVDTRVRILTAAVAAVGGTTALPTWSRLDWRDTNGVEVTSVDWSIVTNVTVVATNGPVRVLFDAEAFAGVVKLGRAVAPSTAAVTIEARALKPFILAADSEGAVDFRLSPVPTATCDLIYLTPSSQTSQTSRTSQTSISVHDRYGREIDVAGEVTFDAAGRKYYLNVQDVRRPAYSNTFDTQYDDSLTTSLGYSGSGNMTYQAHPDQFEKSRSGRALKGDNLQETIHSHNGVATVNMGNVNAWSINFVIKLPTNDKGIVFGWGNKDSGNSIALARVSENVAGVYACTAAGNAVLVASATVPFASTQFHSYAITHDGHTLRFYADGVLAQATPLEGKYPTTGHYQYFKMYGQNGGLENGTSAVVDDFRLYLYCLTPASVRVIADEFKPWPETLTAKVWDPATPWDDLVWSASVENWDAVKYARLERAADGASVCCDGASFANELDLTGGLTLQATNELPFALAPYPKGHVRFTLDDLTTSRRLVRVANAFACDDDDFDVTVRGRDGSEPPDPWMVTRYSDGAYWLRVQDVDRPKYSLTFDNSTSAHVDGSAAPALNDAGGSQFVAARGNAQGALTGQTPYIASLGSYPRWTMHVVAKMPNAANGIVFAYGNRSCQGVALYSPATDTVAIGRWSGAAKQTDFISVSVTNAQFQYHAYAVVHTGSRLALYVDGVKRGEVAVAGYPNDGRAQFFSIHGGLFNGFANGQSGAIDDWRFFEEILAPSGIEMLAEKFCPWPEYRYMRLTETDASWESLAWAGASGSDKPHLLQVAGGSLALDKPLTLSTQLVVANGTLPLKLTGDGMLRADARITFGAGCTIDASGLDGTNLAKCAVAGAPYVRWLVRGAYSWAQKPTVVLPSVPKRYAIRAEDFSDVGIRLVITAPATALFDSTSVNIGPESFAGGLGTLGLYPERTDRWLSYKTWSTDPVTVGKVSVAAIPMEGGKLDPDGTGMADAPLILRNTSFDGNGSAYDGKECGYVVSNLTAFADRYRVLVYLASNMADGGWGPVEIGGRLYAGLQLGKEEAWATVSDATAPNWGKRLATPREGVNVVISDVLTNDAIRLVGHRNWDALRARGQIAAFQIVRVGELFESEAVDYTADITNSTRWSDGAGEGLVPTGETMRWVNDPISTISLFQTADAATLTFDTATTAGVLRVTSSAGQSLALVSTTGDVAVATLDLSEASGTVTVTNALSAGQVVAGGDTRLLLTERGGMSCTVGTGATLTLNTNLLFNVSGDTLASGGTVRYLGAITANLYSTYMAQEGRYGFEKATLTGNLQGEDFARRTIVVEDGDEVTIDSLSQYGCADYSFEINGGHLTYADPQTWFRYQATYRQTGGLVTFNAELGISEKSTTVIPGYTGGGTFTMNISGGTTDVSRTAFWFDQPTAINLSGTGVLKTMGFMGDTGKSHVVKVSDNAVLELGSRGWNDQSKALVLAGGTLRGVDSSKVNCVVEATGTSRLKATSGKTLAFAAEVKGSGTLVCGDGENAGTVVFEKGVASTLAMEGTFSLWLTAAQTNAQVEVVLFRTTAAFDRTKVTVCGPDGQVLPASAGAIAVRDGQAIWMSQATAVPVTVDETTVRVPRAWLAERDFDPQELAVDHALAGANGLPVAVSYALGLEPTNATDNLSCSITIDAEGNLSLTLPNVDVARQPNPEALRYILQHKNDLCEAWQDHSTNSQTTVTVAPDGAPARFFRYLILLK